MNDRILLVEDEENDVFFMQRAMKKAGLHPPHVVIDGQAAIDFLKEIIDRDRKELPGLVLLDLKLPRVMGFDVLTWIRQQPELRDLTVIILTSSKLSSDIESAYERGANSYLVKPNTSVGLQHIVEGIKKCIGQDQPTALGMLRTLSEMSLTQ